MAAGYRVIVVNPDDTVLDTIVLDGRDLTDSGERLYLGEQIAAGMGADARSNCAAAPRPPDED